jgi:hypothetical protein
MLKFTIGVISALALLCFFGSCVKKVQVENQQYFNATKNPLAYLVYKKLQ